MRDHLRSGARAEGPNSVAVVAVVVVALVAAQVVVVVVDVASQALVSVAQVQADAAFSIRFLVVAVVVVVVGPKVSVNVASAAPPAFSAVPQFVFSRHSPELFEAALSLRRPPSSSQSLRPMRCSRRSSLSSQQHHSQYAESR